MKRLAWVSALSVCVPASAWALDVQQSLERNSLFLIGFVFVQGLLTALTPCVYPLIPITVSIFGARDAPRRRAAALSATYVLGIATMFSSIGVAVALTGGLFGRVMTNPIALGLVAVVFCIFAASLFGAFDIALPSGLQGRLVRVGGKGFLGALGMGLVAGIIAAPCAGPVVGGVLAYVGAKGNPAQGFGLLFTYGLGMGVPFFLVGTFSMSLPKSGAWLEGVKSVLAIMLLATAAYLLKDAVPALRAPLRATMPFIGAALALVVVGLLLGAVQRSFHGSWRDRLLKAIGVAMVVTGAYGIAGAVSLPKEDTIWLHDEAAALAQAKQQNKPVFIDLWATWCAACLELDHKIYPQAAFKAEARRFVLFKIDATEADDKIDALLAKYQVAGLPAIRFLDSQGKLLPEPKLNGFVEIDVMLDTMRRVP